MLTCFFFKRTYQRTFFLVVFEGGGGGMHGRLSQSMAYNKKLKELYKRLRALLLFFRFANHKKLDFFYCRNKMSLELKLNILVFIFME